MPSNYRSKTSDMCGSFRRDFEEIPSLPEQTAAQRRSRSAVRRGKNSKKWQSHFFDTRAERVIFYKIALSFIVTIHTLYLCKTVSYADFG